jgi:DnaK suppressor protein
MNTEHFKKVLLKKQTELRDEIARFKGEMRETPAGVEDPIDEVTFSQSKATALEESTFAAGTLTEVEDALRRIDEGSYGRCLDCGREIEPARLAAVPWARYCLQDQEKHDAHRAQAGGSTI